MAGWVGGSSTLGSVGRHSIETTEINRGGEWAGVPPTGPVPQEDGPLPAHLPHAQALLAWLPHAAALTQSTRPTGCKERIIMWGWEQGREARGSRAVSQGWSCPQYSSWSSCWCSSISSSSGGANPSSVAYRMPMMPEITGLFSLSCSWHMSSMSRSLLK